MTYIRLYNVLVTFYVCYLLMYLKRNSTVMQNVFMKCSGEVFTCSHRNVKKRKAKTFKKLLSVNVYRMYIFGHLCTFISCFNNVVCMLHAYLPKT